MSNPLVVDISHYQPDPDFVKLKENGTIGVIHKATEGTSYVDDQLFERAKKAMDAGLSWSTYHFLRGDSSPETQMKHYLGTIDPRQGERVCIDHEHTASLDALRAAVNYIRATRPDLQITIYSGHLIKEQIPGNTKDDFLAANTSLWIAHYTSAAAPTWPKGTWPAWSLWQYTDEGTATGISGNVDANRWNGDPADLPKWFGPAEDVEPEPEPIPEPDKEVLVAITMPEGVNVTVTLNGEFLKANEH